MSDRGQPALRRQEVRERLYELLPAFLRYRDQSEPLDSPLRALMAVLERQYDALDRDIAGLYDDWFIETCQDWIAPYLGDLLGIRGLDTPGAWVPGQRTRIANALAYRRFKGTRGVLERVARDVTGWSCVARPFFDRLSINQAPEHLRPEKGRTVDLRDRLALARFGGPFDSLARRPQISGADGLEPVTDPRDGYNLPNLGLYFWRLQSYPARRRSARKISAGCYTLHPLGVDQPLFNGRRGGGELTEATAERHVPGPLLREVLATELDDLRAGRSAATDYFGRQPAVEIIDPQTGDPIPWQALEIADLSDWRRPESVDREPPTTAYGGDSEPRIVAALDPELGRLAFATDHPAGGEVEVSYHYAGQGDLGGGPYYRTDMVTPGSGPAGGESGATAAAGAAGDGHHRFQSLQEAIANRPANADSAVIQLVDSATYGGWSSLDLEIGLRAGGVLEIGAAPGEAPTFIGDLRVVLGPGAKRSRLTLEGLNIGGRIILATEGEAEDDARWRCDLELRHCTLMTPDQAAGGRDAGTGGGIGVDPAAAEGLELKILVRSSILGPVAIPAGCGELAVFDSIIDGGSGPAIAGALDLNVSACPTEFVRCTLFGRVAVAQVVAEDTIFRDPVSAAARHLSRLAHCYVAPGSSAGSLENCQPGEEGRLEPAFTSRTWGRPGYGQLSDRCPREIRAGASNGSEMGAFSTLGHAFREANLTGILEEYVPWGLQPRIFHVT